MEVEHQEGWFEQQERRGFEGQRGASEGLVGTIVEKGLGGFARGAGAEAGEIGNYCENLGRLWR